MKQYQFLPIFGIGRIHVENIAKLFSRPFVILDGSQILAIKVVYGTFVRVLFDKRGKEVFGAFRLLNALVESIANIFDKNFYFLFHNEVLVDKSIIDLLVVID